MDVKLKEACGVFGIYNLDGENVSNTIYYALIALQHRGQESCGMAISNTNVDEKNIVCYKNMGLVSQVFSKEELVVTLLYILEMSKKGEVFLSQSRNFSKIFIEVKNE